MLQVHSTEAVRYVPTMYQRACIGLRYLGAGITTGALIPFSRICAPVLDTLCVLIRLDRDLRQRIILDTASVGMAQGS